MEAGVIVAAGVFVRVWWWWWWWWWREADRPAAVQQALV